MDPKKLHTLFDLTGRTAIVTGGTRGIGRAIAEGFICAGANVVVASRKADACAETEAHLNALVAGESAGAALGVPTHMGELASLDALVAATVERFGGIDIVVNNAATGLTMPLGQFTPEAWDKQFEVNLRGPIFLIQAALPHLEASDHASVINVISAGAFLASSNVAMYAAAKAALMSFTRSMGAGLASKGVRVNAIAVGSIATSALDIVMQTEELKTALEAGTPLGRIGDPTDIAACVLYLASDAGSYITGKILEVDGGIEGPNLDMGLPDVTA